MFQVDVNDAFTKQTLAELFRTPQSQDFWEIYSKVWGQSYFEMKTLMSKVKVWAYLHKETNGLL